MPDPSASSPREPSPALPIFVVTVGFVVALIVAWFGLVDQLPRADSVDEKNGIRTGTIAAIAGAGAIVTLILNGRSNHLSARAHAHAVREAERSEARHQDQLRFDRAQATRTQFTQLFDSAATKLGADRDTTRTAGIFMLERLFSDAEHSRCGPAFRGEEVDGLQRSIVETICAYVRDESVAHSSEWHEREHPGHQLAGGLHPTYRSPASVRSAIAVLGRLPSVPANVAAFDLRSSHLGEVAFDGTFRTSLELDRSLLRAVWLCPARVAGSVRCGDATFTGPSQFTPKTLGDNLQLTGSVSVLPPDGT